MQAFILAILFLNLNKEVNFMHEMQLTDINVIKKLLGKENFQFSKSLGQNFLINPSIAPRIAELGNASPEYGIIEIGAGIGVLTHELAKRAAKVVTIEIDKKLIPILDRTLAAHDNVKVINGDVMKIDLRELIAEEFKGMRVAVCANLPYYITSPIIMKLLEDELPIDSITVMVQKEAAMRLTAELGTREVGAITVAVRYYSEPKLLFNVSKGSFIPAPKVDSSVIRLDIHNSIGEELENGYENIDRDIFFRVVKASFAQRRKTLLNSLSSGLAMDKPDIRNILDRAGVRENSRAEQLTMEEFKQIAKQIQM